MARKKKASVQTAVPVAVEVNQPVVESVVGPTLDAVALDSVPAEVRNFIFDKYVEDVSISKIAGEVLSKFGVVLSNDVISRGCNSSSNQLFIERARERYLANVRAVPISNKRVRMDELEAMRLDIKASMAGLDREDFSYQDNYVRLRKDLIEVLSEARMEMENKPQFVNNIIINEFSDVNDDELIRRENELVARINAGRVTGIAEDTEGTEEPAS